LDGAAAVSASSKLGDQAPSPAASASGVGHDAAAARRAIDGERLRLIARQTVRAPLGVLIAAAFIAYIMAPHVDAGLAWGWAAAAVGIWCLRAGVSAWLIARPPAGRAIRAWIGRLVAAATLSGAVAGSTAVLFFGTPPLEWALMTMVLCAWSAGGIAVSGAVPGAFYGLVTLFLAPLAVGWLASDMPLRVPVAGMILFFLAYLILFARDGAGLVSHALQVGYENEELARQLRLSETEARAARERAEQANLAKSRFLATASHDLRQPLHALALLLDHALRATTDPKTAHTLQQAARSADSLNELFTGLLDLSRLDSGSLVPEFKPLALGSLLERIANDYRPHAVGKGLAFHCASTQAWVRSDPVMLDRILRNLLDNAVKYTAAGAVAIEVHEGQPVQPGDALDAVAAGEICQPSLRVTVRDTGIGIGPADLGHVFDEYYQVHSPSRDRTRGSGLGLAIVKRLAGLLGHAVQVESEPGKGSAFSLTLTPAAPAAAKPADALAAPDDAALAVLRGAVVAVIEDDAQVRAATGALLADWGCRAVLADDSAAAITALDAAGLEPDAILADWRLTGAENGVQAIERLHRRYGERLAAIVTGEIEPAAIERPAHLPLIVLKKPLRARELAEWLLRWKTIE
jgi:signal transduction histidine kinase